MQKLFPENVRRVVSSRVTSDPGFVIKAASSAIAKNGAAVGYLVDGEFKSLTVDTDFPLTGADCNITVPDGYTALFVCAISAAGAAKVFQSRQFIGNTAVTVDKGDRDSSGNKTLQTRYQVFYATKNGSATILQSTPGTIESMSQALPELPNGYVAAGVIKVRNASGANFVPGTTALDAANVTVTYTDISVVPASKNY